MVRGRRPTGVPIARDKEGVRLIPGVPLSGSSRFALPRAIAVTLSGFILWWFSIALLLVVGLWILAHGLWNFLRVPLCIPPCSLWLNLDPRCLRPQGVPIARESLISAPNNRSVIPIRQWPDRVPSVHHTSSSRAECNGAWRSVCWAAPSL